jgi:hypothetical protein
MAGYLVPVTTDLPGWHFLLADVSQLSWAPGMEYASTGRKTMRGRFSAKTGPVFAHFFPFQMCGCGKKRLGIRMMRAGEDRFSRSDLHHATEVQHHDPV